MHLEFAQAAGDVVLMPLTSVPTVDIRLVFGSGTAVGAIAMLKRTPAPLTSVSNAPPSRFIR